MAIAATPHSANATAAPVTRRRLLASLGSIIALPFLPRTPSIVRRGALIQTSPVAGFQYHEGERVWPRLCVGDPLSLVRESANKHDPRAVRIDWSGHKLGYVPRLENTAVAQMLDRGAPLEARILRLTETLDPWKRVQFRVELKL